MELAKYKDFIDKHNVLQSYISVNTKEDLDKCIQFLVEFDKFKKSLPLHSGLMFRGVKEAAYKMYTSAQRRYIDDDDKLLNLLTPDLFLTFITKAIGRVRNDTRYQEWIREHNTNDNDFLILAILQHYKLLSPMIDFCEDIYTGLFFACDHASLPDYTNSISDYISLYYVDTTIDWIRTSLQEYNRYGGNDINSLLSDHVLKGNELPDCRQVLFEMTKLPYYKIGGDPSIKFISVTGPEAGVTEVTIPIIGYSTKYNIYNERIKAQHGRFILNTTENTPLIELMNVTANKKMVNCIDIHKSLIPYIQEKYINPNGISEEIVYPKTQESIKMETIIDSLFPE